MIFFKVQPYLQAEFFQHERQCTRPNYYILARDSVVKDSDTVVKSGKATSAQVYIWGHKNPSQRIYSSPIFLTNALLD